MTSTTQTRTNEHSTATLESDVAKPHLDFGVPQALPAAIDRSKNERLATFSFLRQQLSVGLPLCAADMCAIGIALLVGTTISSAFVAPINHPVAFCCGGVIAYALCLWGAGLYPGVGWHPARELRQLFRTILSASLAFAVALIMISSWRSPYVATIGIGFVLLLALIPICRAIAKSTMRSASIGIPFFFVGNRNDVMRAYRDMNRFGWTMLQPHGRFAEADLDSRDVWEHANSPDDTFEWRFEQQVTYRGTPDCLISAAKQEHVYWLFVVGDNAERVLNRQPELLTAFPELVFLRTPGSRLNSCSSLLTCGLTSGLRFEESLLLPWPRWIKRSMDVLLSGAALLALLPLLLSIMVLVRCTSPGPAFFSHRRLGRGGKYFPAWKFRSMVPNASEVLRDYLGKHPELLHEWECDHKLKDDPRITTIGKILRKTSLDELPQLWNVFIGDMSLVGPRPIVDAEVVKYGLTYEDYLRVLPGITGLWQVSGRNNTSYEERLMYDEFYVRHWSPWMDVYILMRTIRTVVCCEGAY